jgi:hypothetical protein
MTEAEFQRLLDSLAKILEDLDVNLSELAQFLLSNNTGQLEKALREAEARLAAQKELTLDLKRQLAEDRAHGYVVSFGTYTPSGCSAAAAIRDATGEIVAAINIVRSRIGRAFIAIRDQDIAAEIIGINIFRYKLIAFAISSFYAGVCGVLYTYYFGIANYEAFQIVVSIDYLAMIIIGGLGSVLGSILGAIFVTMLPIAIRLFVETFGSYIWDTGALSAVAASMRLIIFGVLIIFFLVVEPEGLNRLWRNIRNYFRVWPFSY